MSRAPEGTAGTPPRSELTLAVTNYASALCEHERGDPNDFDALTKVAHTRNALGIIVDALYAAIETRDTPTGRADDAALWAAFCKGLVHGELNILEQDTSKPHSISETPSWGKYQAAVKANGEARAVSPLAATPPQATQLGWNEVCELVTEQEVTNAMQNAYFSTPEGPGSEAELVRAVIANERASRRTSAGYGAKDWQPIETAPKDGTPILIYQPEYEDGNELAWQRHTQHNAFNGEDVEATDTTSFDDHRYAIGYWRPWGGWGNRNSSRVNPTHWTPLPALPRAAAVPSSAPTEGDQ